MKRLIKSPRTIYRFLALALIALSATHNVIPTAAAATVDEFLSSIIFNGHVTVLYNGTDIAKVAKSKITPGSTHDEDKDLSSDIEWLEEVFKPSVLRVLYEAHPLLKYLPQRVIAGIFEIRISSRPDPSSRNNRNSNSVDVTLCGRSVYNKGPLSGYSDFYIYRILSDNDRNILNALIKLTATIPSQDILSYIRENRLASESEILTAHESLMNSTGVAFTDDKITTANESLRSEMSRLQEHVTDLRQQYENEKSRYRAELELQIAEIGQANISLAALSEQLRSVEEQANDVQLASALGNSELLSAPVRETVQAQIRAFLQTHFLQWRERLGAEAPGSSLRANIQYDVLSITRRGFFSRGYNAQIVVHTTIRSTREARSEQLSAVLDVVIDRKGRVTLTDEHTAAVAVFGDQLIEAATTLARGANELGPYRAPSRPSTARYRVSPATSAAASTSLATAEACEVALDPTAPHNALTKK